MSNYESVFYWGFSRISAKILNILFYAITIYFMCRVLLLYGTNYCKVYIIIITIILGSIIR